MKLTNKSPIKGKYFMIKTKTKKYSKGGKSND